jgi:hypothetical protein
VTSLPQPAWPLVVLAAISVADGVLCIRPARFVARCLDDVRWPRRYWPLLTPIKLAAAVGLIAGLWVRYLGAITCAALVLYFMAAIAMHVRARDFGRNLFLNATGMLVICAATGVYCFLV